MQFEEEFFLDEYREDFFVNSRMKRYWAASIETLEEVDKVCRKNGITWYADWGTLLGTIRHKGFIPWDDDIDIAMKRCDYEKFLEIAPKELPEHYVVFNSSMEKFWVNNAAAVSNWNQDMLVLEKKRLEKYHGCPFYISIDVFPLDYMYKDREREELRQRILMEIWYTLAVIDMKNEQTDLLQRLHMLEMLLQTKLSEWNGDYRLLKRELRQLVDIIFQICMENEADELTELRWLVLGDCKQAHFKKEWYEDIIYMPFEGFQMPVPIGYHEILKGMYGDYMTPVKGKASHDYPKFKKQLRIIDEWKKSIGETRAIEQIISDLMEK